MMLIGRIAKEDGGWLAECESAGAFTQGKSRVDALVMLADCIETLVNDRDLEVEAVEIEPSDDAGSVVLVRANRPELLAARVLKYQRELNRLTQEEAAKRSNAGRQSDYAVYERGERSPSLSKYIELLGAVAPDFALAVVEVKKR